MFNKILINKKWFILFCITVIVVMFAVKWGQSSEPGLSLGTRENIHQWRIEGECADCHSEHEYVKEKVKLGVTKAIPAAKSHTDKFRRFTHGKLEYLASHNCSSCHQTQECVACHANIPESHTQDFVAPTGDSPGMFRHIALGRNNITACYTCHRSFNKECTTCHGVDEVGPWQNEAEKASGRWREMLIL